MKKSLRKLKLGQTKVYALSPEYFQNYGNRGYEADYKQFGFDLRGMINSYKRHNLMPRSILDCGSAMGQTVEDLRNAGFDAYGIEISDYAIRRVPERLKPYCVQLDMRDVKKLDRNFDSVYLNSLMYLTESEIHTMLDDLHDIVNQSIYIITPFKDYPETIPKNDKHRKSLFTRQWWLTACAKHGFEYCRGTNMLFKKV